MERQSKVLIVDDDRFALRSMAKVLEGESYQVVTVASGSEAIELLKQDSFDLVLADLKMPEVDGLEVLRQARAMAPQAGVLILTGYASLESAIEALREGAYDYLVKPCSDQELKLRIEKGLERVRLAEERQRAEEALRRAEAEARGRLEEQIALREAGAIITSTLDPSEVLARIAEQMGLAIDATSACITQHEPETMTCTVVAEYVGPEACDQERVSDLGVTYHYTERDIKFLRAMEAGRHDISQLDDPDLPESERAHMQEYGAQTILYIPLRIRGRLVGYTELWESRRRREFTPQEIALCQDMAQQAAVALENARLYEEAQRELAERQRAEEEIRQRTAQLEALRQVGLELAAHLDLDALLRSIVSRAVELLGGNSGALDLYRPDGDVLEWAVSVGSDKPLSNHLLHRGEGLCGKVWETGKPLIVDDYHRWEGRVSGWEGYPFQAVMGVPVRWSGEFLGVLQVSAAPPRTFSPADAELLGLFASQAAIAIRNARLYEETRSRAERLAVVNRIARAASATLHLDDLMEIVYREVTSVFEADAFFIALCDEEANELDYRLRVDEGIREPRERRPLGTGLTSLVVAEKKPLLIRDFEKEKDYLPEVRLWGTMKAPASWLGVPMLIGQRLTGVICVQAYRPHAYGEEEELLLSTIADQVAVAIENARLYQETQRHSERLAQTLAVSESLHRDLELEQLLEQIAQGTVELGFRRAVINVCQPGEELVRARAMAGLEGPEREALMGATYRWSDFQALMQERFQVSRSYLIRHGEVDWEKDFQGVVVTSRREDRGPSYWHPEDMFLIPLWGSRGEPLGLLSVDEPVDGLLPDLNTIQTLEAFANQAAIAIENARLYEVEQQRRRDAEALRETALALTSALDRNQVIERILTQLQQVVPYDSASVQLLQGDRLVITGGRGFPNLEELLGISFPVEGDNPNREVIRTRAPFIVDDAPAVYEGFRKGPHMQTVISSWLGVPMLIGEQLVGMIALDKREPGFYTEEHARLAQTFAAQAAVAVENARLFEEVEKRRLYLEGVLGAAPDAIVTLDAHNRIVEWNPGAERLFGYSRGEVIGQNIDDLVTRPEVLEEAVSYTQIVMGGREVPPTEAVRYRKDGSAVDVIVAGSPIVVGDEFIGAVAVYTDITARKRMEEELRALLLVDELTGLYNRRGFLTLGQQQLRMANRMRRRMLLLFADFNHLKLINDTFGHPEGDQALIEVAHVLRETFRESDIMARMAGDEFVVLALETVDDSAEILTARLQQGLAAHNAREGRRYKLSLSVGVARYDPRFPCSIDDLVARADRAMYEQKRGDQS